LASAPRPLCGQSPLAQSLHLSRCSLAVAFGVGKNSLCGFRGKTPLLRLRRAVTRGEGPHSRGRGTAPPSDQIASSTVLLGRMGATVDELGRVLQDKDLALAGRYAGSSCGEMTSKNTMFGDAPKNTTEDEKTVSPALIRWSIQEIRCIAIRLAQRRVHAPSPGTATPAPQ